MKSVNMNNKDIVWILLKKNISKSQLLGYIISNIIGFAIILAGIMFYKDCRHIDDGQEVYFSRDYVVLSKKVSGVGLAPISFDETEIRTLERQKWVKKIGRFTSSQFTVRGALELGSKHLSSYLFLESVPDEFFDIKPKGWDFSPNERMIPVILSKDYLTLYNFGFAVPQGLPQIGEELIGDIPLSVRLIGQDKVDEFEAKIVGFSSRLNTIAVPQSFMDWANQRYAHDVAKTNPSRLIVEIDRLNAEAMDKYLAESEIEMAGDKTDAGNISKFLSMTSAIVTINGFLICSLATFILLLSVYLLLHKNKTTLNHLILLGFSPKEVGKYYERIVVVVNIVTTIIAIVIVSSSRTIWLTYMDDIGIGGASTIYIYITSLIYFILTTLINVFVIRNQLNSMWQS